MLYQLSPESAHEFCSGHTGDKGIRYGACVPDRGAKHGENSSQVDRPATAEPIPSILRSHLYCSDPVVFPNGEVALEAWEFGRFDVLAPEVVEEITNCVVQRAYEVLAPVVRRKSLVLVCYGRPMHRLGVRLAEKMRAEDGRDVHVVLAVGFNHPEVHCLPTEFSNAQVAVLVDVAHTGRLQERLTARTRANSRRYPAAGHRGKNTRRPPVLC